MTRIFLIDECPNCGEDLEVAECCPINRRLIRLNLRCENCGKPARVDVALVTSARTAEPYAARAATL